MEEAEPTLFCSEIEVLRKNPPTCIDDFMTWGMRMFDLLVEEAGCANPCTVKEIARVPPETLSADFLSVGWPGDTRPSYAQAKTLTVIRECAIFMAVNDSTCDFTSGLAWQQLGNGNITPTAQLVFAPEEVLTQSATYVNRPVTGQWSEMYNNGIQLAIGLQPRLDNNLLDVPTRCFQIGAGAHEIEVNVGTQWINNNSTENTVIDVQLYDVTNTDELFTQQRARVQSVASTMHSFHFYVNNIDPTVYAIRYRVNHTGLTMTSTGFDEIIIKKQV